MNKGLDGLDLERHRDLRGLRGGQLARRALLALLFLMPLLALFDVFGQTPSTSRGASASARLVVRVPDRLRGGLLYQLRFEIDSIRPLHRPTLVLSNGWWEELSLNAIIPNPNTQSYVQGGVSLQFGPLPANGRLRGWISFQANPTAVGRRSVNVLLEDGGRVLARIHRSLIIFP